MDQTTRVNPLLQLRNTVVFFFRQKARKLTAHFPYPISIYIPYSGPSPLQCLKAIHLQNKTACVQLKALIDGRRTLPSHVSDIHGKRSDARRNKMISNTQSPLKTSQGSEVNKTIRRKWMYILLLIATNETTRTKSSGCHSFLTDHSILLFRYLTASRRTDGTERVKTRLRIRRTETCCIFCL